MRTSFSRRVPEDGCNSGAPNISTPNPQPPLSIDQFLSLADLIRSRASGSSLRSLRLSADLTQRELAALVQTTSKWIYQLERGIDGRATIDVAGRILEALGVTLADLVAQDPLQGAPQQPVARSSATNPVPEPLKLVRTQAGKASQSGILTPSTFTAQGQ